MNTRAVLIAVPVVVAILLGGAGTLLGEDSPYERNVDVESVPVPPDGPARSNRSSVEHYAVAVEERLLYNDLLASREHSLDANDRVVTNCTAVSVSRPDTGGFRVRLRCRGGIDDSLRVLDPDPFTYSVTYRVTEDETRQVGLRNYPFDPDRGFNDCGGELACSTSTPGNAP